MEATPMTVLGSSSALLVPRPPKAATAAELEAAEKVVMPGNW